MKKLFHKINLKIAVVIYFSSLATWAQNSKLEALSIEPPQVQITFDQEQEFIVHGGQPPYVFKTSAGLIRYKDNTATYISPNTVGEATVTVKDAAGDKKVVTIKIISNGQESQDPDDSDYPDE